MKGIRQLAALGAIALGLLSLSCAKEAALPRHVVLIVVDTLRNDHLGAYGASRPTSPAIDALASRGTTFENAYTVSPWTLASVASIHTGLYPLRHGALDPRSTLSTDATTLAEILRDAGYRTVGVISNELLTSRYQVDQGFLKYVETEARGHQHVSTKGVSNWAKLELNKLVGAGSPFFLFVHYFDPHYVYLRHPQFGFSSDGAGRLYGGERIKLLRDFIPDMTDEELDFIRDSYDEEIRLTDGGIADLLGELDRLGVRDETLVIVTADHGEEFLDHGWIGHTRTLYDDVMRVPLIVQDPGRGRGNVVREPTTVVGIAPTVLDLLGLDPAPYGFQESSFASAVTGEGGARGDVFLEVDFVPLFPDNEVKATFKKAVVRDRWKVIRDDSTDVWELYDLEADPGEIRNLADEKPRLLAELRVVLEKHVAETKENAFSSKSVELTARQIERLRSLGYAGN